MNDLPEDGATLMVGIPGCGKTYRAFELHNTIPEYSVFFNTMLKKPHYTPNDNAPRVKRLDDEAIKKLNDTGKLTIDTDDVAEVEKWLDYFEAFWSREYGPLRVFFDETDEFAGCWDRAKENRVARVFTKDRNKGILGVAICQSHSGQVSAIIKKNAHCYFLWRLHPGEFDEYGKYYGLPLNPPVNPGDFSPYHRYALGHLFYTETEGNERPVQADGETEEALEDDNDDEEVEGDGVSAEDNPAEGEELPKPSETGEAPKDENPK